MRRAAALKRSALWYTVFGEGPGPTRTIRMRNGSRGEGAE
jgi:hypothetical protein